MIKEDTTNRRNRIDLMKPAELAIFNAMQEIEKIGADPKLTDAQMFLTKAKDLVSDFIDTIDIVRDFHYYKCPECGDLAITHNKSPLWLINQIEILQIHQRTAFEPICRTPYVGITKEEYFKLTFDKYENPTQIK